MRIIYFVRITRTARRLYGEGRSSCHQMLRRRDKRTEKGWANAKDT